MEPARPVGGSSNHGASPCIWTSETLGVALLAAGATATFNLIPGVGHDEAIAALQTPIALDMLKSVFGRYRPVRLPRASGDVQT